MNPTTTTTAAPRPDPVDRALHLTIRLLLRGRPEATRALAIYKARYARYADSREPRP